MKGIQKISLTLFIGFLLGISDGYITLWKDSGGYPLQVFPYRAEMLPPADQQALEKGIYITGKQDLARLLEDYLS